MSAPDLATTRLVLRRVTPADRADLRALEADPEVMRYLNGGKPVPEDGDPEGAFLCPRGSEPDVWVAHERATGAFVGWFMLRAREDDGATAVIGYRLRRACWGRGLATEGVRALVEAGLEHLGFERIRGETMAVNTASRRVMEKAGLRHVATYHAAWPDPLPGAESGEVVYEARGVRQG